MHKIYKISVIVSFLLLQFTNVIAQQKRTIKKPEVGIKYACASNVFNSFDLKFDFSGGVFERDNVFSVELSDKKGSFSSPKVIGTVKSDYTNGSTMDDYNHLFYNIPASYKIPEGTNGKGYKIRIKSSNPSVVGASSDPVEIHYREVGETLILNNQEDVVLCSTGSVEVGFNYENTDYKYRWYRNDRQIEGETKSTLKISQIGVYYARVEMGICTNSDKANPPSTKINVTQIKGSKISLSGSSLVKLCPEETYDFEVFPDNANYKYTWFKDDVKIEGLPDYAPKYSLPKGTEKFGKYYVQIKSSCSIQSQDVVVTSKEGGDFDLSISGGKNKMILPGQNLNLVTETTASSPNYQWYKDGRLMTGEQKPNLTVSQPGTYYVSIKNGTAVCVKPVKSEEVKVFNVKGLSVDLKTEPAYEDCKYSEIDFKSMVKVTSGDGNEYDLGEDQLKFLNFEWLKNDVAISGVNSGKYSLNSYKNNGKYAVKVATKDGNVVSDLSELAVRLTKGGFELKSTSPTNAICTNGSLKLKFTLDDSEVTDLDNKWFKDGEEIAENTSNVDIDSPGTYSVTFDTVGCSNELGLVVTLIEDVSVELTPSSNIVLEKGETTMVEAKGAESYEWYDSNDKLLSSKESLVVKKIGKYRLVAKAGDCDFEKEFEVLEPDGKTIISNMISPFNADGVNDTWVLPNTLAFSTETKVLIFDTNGKTVLDTVDYQNNWPQDIEKIKNKMLFYYKIVKKGVVIKSGTISVLR